MSDSLAGAFSSGGGRKTTWQGLTVESMIEIPVADGDRIKLTRLSSSTVRAQALKLGIDKGELRANGVLMQTAAIWTHTSPIEIHLEVVGRRAKSVDIWNSWSSDGVDSSWLGSAGMLVERTPSCTTLRCSDGLGEPTFDDLIVKLEIVK